MRKKIINGVIKYLSSFLLFTLFSFTCKAKSLSLAVLCGLLYAGFSPYFLTATYILSLFVDFSLLSFLVGVCECVILSAFFIFYKGKKPKAEILIYLFVALCPYLFATPVTIKKALYTAVIIVFSLVSQVAVPAVYQKIINCRLTLTEAFSVSLFTIGLGLGAINADMYLLWKCLGIFCILLTGYLYGQQCLFFSVAISFPIALASGNYGIIAPFIIVGCFGVALSESKVLSASSVLLSEIFFVYLTNVYAGYTYTEFAFTVAGASLFAITPKSFADSLKERVNSLKDNRLSRYIINRSRLVVADRLYNLSYVFGQVCRSISSLQDNMPTEEQAASTICSNVMKNVCRLCPLGSTCSINGFPDTEKLKRLAKIGLNKGKLSLVDLPTDFTASCSYINNALFSINKDIAFFKGKISATENFSCQSDLISLQAKTFSSVAKELANSFGKTLVYNSEKEQKILLRLQTSGVFASEINCYGSGEEQEVWVLTDKSAYDEYKLSKALSEYFGYELFPYNTTSVSLSQICVCYKKAPALDAVFGIKQVCKKGNTVSGDTHSLFKINEGKFVCALNDGMGSGKTANKVSSVTLDMLECFFSAGMNCDIALKMLDNVMAIASPEAFTALDLCLVDLYNGNAEFIKIGAPYGYVITQSGIKIVEGSSLPLGSIGQTEQISGKYKLCGKDTIVLVTDGVTDAFGSSIQLMDYIKSLQNKNPQTLAEKIVEQALLRSGEAKDDLSCLCIKIFKRNNC